MLELNPRRVLITCLVRGDTRRYRSIHLVEQLRLAGVSTEFVHLADPEIWRQLEQPWSVVVFQRVDYNQHLDRLLQSLRKNGTIVLSDFDDLIFDPSAMQFIDSPDFVDPVRASLYKANMANIHSMLERSDACLASTDFLAERILQEEKPVWIHRNAFSLEMLSYSEKARQNKRKVHGKKIVVGYASGTPTHNKDFEFIKPFLIKLMRKYDHMELNLIGPLEPGDGWGGLEERIHRQKLVPWRRLPEYLANFDINLAPLIQDNPFSQSKSEIKYMETAMVEVPTVASPTDAYKFAIRHGENGWLANDEEAWIEGISALVEDETLRLRVGRQAYQDVMRDYHPSVRARQIIQVLNQVSTQLRGELFDKSGLPADEDILQRVKQIQANSAWLPAKYMQEPSRVKLSYYTLRHRGLLALLMSGWVYFRRLIAPILPFPKSRQS